MKPFKMRTNRQFGIAAFAQAIVFMVLWNIFPSSAQQPSNASNWDKWNFFLGEWIGEGGGSPGQATGGFTFSLDLADRILVRRSRADYPAAQDRPAFSHEDLTIIYHEPNESTRAIYFDNEGHAIQYAVNFSEDENAATFVSDPSPSAPRFRLIYMKTSDKTVSMKFDIALTGNPDAFKTYIESTARRK
jgi:hypothetical protein